MFPWVRGGGKRRENLCIYRGVTRILSQRRPSSLIIHYLRMRIIRHARKRHAGKRGGVQEVENAIECQVFHIILISSRRYVFLDCPDARSLGLIHRHNVIIFIKAEKRGGNGLLCLNASYAPDIAISSLHRWAFSGPRHSNDSKPSHEYECELKLLTCDAKQASRKCMENAVIDSRLQNQQLFLCRIYLLWEQQHRSSCHTSRRSSAF